MEFQSMKDLKILPPSKIPLEDGLGMMLKLQSKLNKDIYPKIQKNLRIKRPTNSEEYNLWREKMTKEYLLAIIRECVEALDMLNSKPWKETRKEVNVRELKFEIIDIQHFVNSLYDIWRMDREEVLGIFLAKYEENQRRVKDGY